MITVEIKDVNEANLDRCEVEIYCDSDGLKELKQQIAHLESGETHVHLMTQSWAGSELSEELHGKNNHLVHHLRVVRRG
jgi:hypothetical protein